MQECRRLTKLPGLGYKIRRPWEKIYVFCVYNVHVLMNKLTDLKLSEWVDVVEAKRRWFSLRSEPNRVSVVFDNINKWLSKI